MLDQVRGKCFVHFVKHSAVAYISVNSDSASGATPSSSCSTSQSLYMMLLNYRCYVVFVQKNILFLFFPVDFFDKDHLFFFGIIFICIKTKTNKNILIDIACCFSRNVFGILIFWM